MAYTDIDDPSVHFQTALYTGNATQRDITNDGNSDLQPDWVWIKCRSAVESNMLYDSTRGVTKDLRSDTAAADNTNTEGLQAFNSDGFQIGTLQNVNFNTKTMVAWQWKANGGTTASNTDGSITSTVQANTDAGFSIVTYTGTGSAATVGHGLGKVPSLIILKRRDSSNTWLVKHQNNTSNKNLQLHTTNAELTTSDFTGGIIGDLSSSTVFSTVAGSSGVVNVSSSNDFIAYCFAEKQGYSKFGSYVGNGNANGTFVYTGFKPAWVMCKSTASTSDWYIYDNKREGYNKDNDHLLANSTAVEATADEIDMLSNGFKLRIATDPNVAEAYIYMAFAEHPFVSSEGVPTTAR
jgi:hypothetical protein